MKKLIMKLGTTVLLAVIGVAWMLFGAALIAVPTYLVWNAVVPDVLGFKPVTLLQALGLNFLAALLTAKSKLTYTSS